jgi:glycine/sarcosine N-methyltransferase
VLKVNGRLMIQILNYDYIVHEKLSSLPLIDNETIRFERSYSYLQNGKIAFTTQLLVKNENHTSTHCIELLPVSRNELSEMLIQIGFSDIEWYGNFAGYPLKNNSLPLVVSASKK